MLVGFKDARTSDLWSGKLTSAVRRIPHDVVARAVRRLGQLDSAKGVDDLKIPPGNRLEKLVGDRAGQWSVRVNDQWRICFKWAADAAGPHDVELCDYHG